MINTYQTSLAPPPVPPRHGRSHPVLIPAPLPSQGHSRSLVRFLVGAVLLHLFLSVGGFVYLYHNDKMLSFQLPSPKARKGEAAHLLAVNQEASEKVLARLSVEHRSNKPDQKSKSGYLQWNIDHSVLKNIRSYYKSWLTILQPGDYYVYSRVTFSKGDSKKPLTSLVKLRKSVTEDAKTVMQAYCNMDNSNSTASNPHMCTATQGELVKLEEGNQLSVFIEDLSLVNYEEGATTFGMYKL